MGRACALIGLLGSFVLTACGASEDGITQESNLIETSKPRQGSTIDSPSVDPEGRYWGARSIEILKEVGYLTDAAARLAERADGIIANVPSNGRLGVDELARLESPEHANTLFPEEKAMFPKLWEIMRIDDAPNVSLGEVTFQHTVVDDYAVSSFQLPISELDYEDQKLAARVQLSADSDSDPSTISGPDLDYSYAHKESYLPDEVLRFARVAAAIANNAPRLGVEAQMVEIKNAVTSAVVNVDPVSITATATLVLPEPWSKPTVKPSPSLTFKRAIKIKNPSSDTHVIVLDSTSGEDTLVKDESGSVPGASRVEVWSGGARTKQVDVAYAPAPAPIPVPLGATIKNGEHYDVFRYDVTGGASYAAKQPVRLEVPSGSYFPQGYGDVRVDLLDNARARLIRSDGAFECYLVDSIKYIARSYDCFNVKATKIAKITLGASKQSSLGEVWLAASKKNHVLLPF